MLDRINTERTILKIINRNEKLIFRTERRTVAAVILLWAIVLLSSSPVFLAHGLINVKVTVMINVKTLYADCDGRMKGVVWTG